MPDNTESFEAYDRTHRLIESLLNGEGPVGRSHLSRQEADMLRLAGELNAIGARPRPSAEFVQSLARELGHKSEPMPKRLWTRLTRRGMLRGVASAAGLLIAGAAADRLVGGLGSAGAMPGWVAVARVAELAPGTAIRFLAAGREGYAINLDGTLRAMSALCTHLPCVLQWSGGQREFVCPCHQAQFGADGQHRPTPSYDHQLPPLPSFRVKQVGGLIYVFPGESSSVATDDDEEYQHR